MHTTVRRSRATRPALAALLPLLATALLLAAPARALELDFDTLPDLSDAAAATLLGGASVSPAQVLSEASVNTLLGYDAAGTWATSGSQGILNSLGASITFSFAVPVTEFSIDILSLEKDGITLAIRLVGLYTDGLGGLAFDVSDPAQIGDSGFHEQRLSLAGHEFTSITLEALFDCGGFEPCVSTEGTTFFADSASYTLVPEPGTLALVAAGLAGLAAVRRGGRA